MFWGVGRFGKKKIAELVFAEPTNISATLFIHYYYLFIGQLLNPVEIFPEMHLKSTLQYQLAVIGYGGHGSRNLAVRAWSEIVGRYMEQSFRSLMDGVRLVIRHDIVTYHNKVAS